MNIQTTVAEHIAKFQFSVMAVGGTETRCSFTYTIGLTELPHAEFIVFGMSPHLAHTLLSQVAERVKNGHKYQDGDVIDDLANLPFALRLASEDKSREYAIQSYERYKDTAQVPLYFQLVLPDREGRFPWTEGVDKVLMAHQPVLWDTLH